MVHFPSFSLNRRSSGSSASSGSSEGPASQEFSPTSSPSSTPTQSNSAQSTERRMLRTHSPILEYLSILGERHVDSTAPVGNDVQLILNEHERITSSPRHQHVRHHQEPRRSQGLQQQQITPNSHQPRLNTNELEAVFQASQEELHTSLLRFGGAIRAALNTSNGGQKSPPPASEKAIQRLPHVRILPWHREKLAENSTCCGICQDRLADGVALSRMPCGHVYHINCIIPWLTRTCTCPECRYEIATNDMEYEVGRRERMKDRVTYRCDCHPYGTHECFFTSDLVQKEKEELEQNKTHTPNKTAAFAA